ncbi:MAG: peptidoglycan editing factor PgeF [Gammaproteobacteria bacterium]|nr:MAG: peptidoglycan editing factor PgeF [Gammaproteobacteria bacterium]
MLLIKPNWHAPCNIQSFCTTRNYPENSKNPYENFNLATHVGDDISQVQKNRKKLEQHLKLAKPISYLNQNHTDKWTLLDKKNGINDKDSDAVYSFDKNCVCAVLTADCLPILLCNKKGDFIAAVHAGWQGLENEIIKKITDYYPKTADLLCWIGPSISKKSFEVGEEIYQKFSNKNPAYKEAFEKHKNKLFLDNVTLAKIQLKSTGINKIYGGNYNTYTDKNFYSYRRNNKCGRMASLIWME